MKKLTSPKTLPLMEVLEIITKIKAERDSKNVEQLIDKIEDKLANGNFRYSEVSKYISVETTDYYDNDVLDEVLALYEKAGWHRVTVHKRNQKITINFYYPEY